MRNNKFETKWTSLKNQYEHGSFKYDDASKSIGIVSSLHFNQVKQPDKPCVYLIRQKCSRDILYIGRAGTIQQDGKFKDQCFRGRIGNRHSKKVSRTEWFKTLFKENGPLVIEYVFLTTKPQSPAMVEALLMQTYLNEHSCLPCHNKKF